MTTYAVKVFHRKDFPTKAFDPAPPLKSDCAAYRRRKTAQRFVAHLETTP